MANSTKLFGWTKLNLTNIGAFGVLFASNVSSHLVNEKKMTWVSTENACIVRTRQKKNRLEAKGFQPLKKTSPTWKCHHLLEKLQMFISWVFLFCLRNPKKNGPYSWGFPRLRFVGGKALDSMGDWYYWSDWEAAEVVCDEFVRHWLSLDAAPPCFHGEWFLSVEVTPHSQHLGAEWAPHVRELLHSKGSGAGVQLSQLWQP